MRYELEGVAPNQRIEAAPSPKPSEGGLRTVIRKGFPSPFKVVVRAFMLVGMLFGFLYFDLYAPLEPKVPITGDKFTLYLTACVSIATIFCSGYLLLTRGSRGRPGVEADIPSMLLVWAKVGISMGVAYLAYVLDLIPRFAMLFIVGAMAAVWAVFATASFTYYAFRRIH